MTQVFSKEGQMVPVTVLQVGPCVITQVRTKEKHGYNALQLGFCDKKEKHVTKPVLGQFKKAGVTPKRFLKEIRTEQVEGFNVGQELKVDQFEVGEFIDIQGVSIGKGFQGVVKRHHFRGGPKSHGSMFGRVAGSIGASSFPSRVVKGMRMAGQMGDQNTTIQNLRVVQVDPENHLLVVKGAVPGTEEGYVVVHSSLKKNKAKQWKKIEKAEKAAEGPAEKAPENAPAKSAQEKQPQKAQAQPAQ